MQKIFVYYLYTNFYTVFIHFVYKKIFIHYLYTNFYMLFIHYLYTNFYMLFIHDLYIIYTKNIYTNIFIPEQEFFPNS